MLHVPKEQPLVNYIVSHLCPTEYHIVWEAEKRPHKNLIPETYECYLICNKRIFVYVIKLRFVRWGDYPRSWGGGRNAVRCILARGRQWMT